MGWRRGLLYAGAAALVVFLAAGAFLWFRGWFSPSEPSAPPAPDAPGLAQAEADRLAEGLADRDPERVAEVLSSDAAAAYLENPAPVVPEDATLELDASTFTATSEVDGVVGGTFTAGSDVTDVVLMLALEDGEWRVLTSVTA
jgi:hypothetical protein